MTSRWAFVLGSVLIAIPVAIAVGTRRKRSLGDDSFEDDDDEDDDDDEPYGGKLRKDDGDCLLLGKDHPLYKFGAYRVCLTASQKKTLFQNKSRKKLGCGVFACAYETSDPGKVVKFTRDAEDVAALLEAQKLGVVPKVYKTYELFNQGESVETGETKPVYALVVEKLKPFSPAEREVLDEQMFSVNDILSELKRDPEMSVAEACVGMTGNECDTITRQTIEAAQKLRANGIRWDDIHSGNIGLDKKGDVKVLDLGITGTQLKKAPQILAGALKRLAKKRDVQPM